MSATNITQVSDPLAALSASSAQSAKSAGATSGDANQDRFLTLLVTQLKNQDPLNPMDNAQITSQLAQINTVQGIDKLNTTLTALSGSMTSTQTLQTASLVGRQVLVGGSEIDLSQGNAVAGFSLDQAVDQLTVTVRDAAGAPIHTVELGPQSPGIHLFAWDGATDQGAQAADGRYSFSVGGLAAGTKIDGTSLSIGLVNGVTPGKDGGTTINIGTLGDKSLADIKRIL